MPFTFWLSLVAKRSRYSNRTVTFIEQSSLSFLIASKCSGANLVRSIAFDCNCCVMAKAGGYDLFSLFNITSA